MLEYLAKKRNKAIEEILHENININSSDKSCTLRNTTVLREEKRSEISPIY